MSLTFIETIRVEDNKIELFELHKKRVELTCATHNFPQIALSLEEIVTNNSILTGVVKYRFEYGCNGIITSSYTQYTPREIKSLKLISDNEIEYPFKSSSRKIFETLFSHRENDDDVIIIKNGYITDTSFSNVVLSRNSEFFTPNTYLLNGVRRQSLLTSGYIIEIPITVNDLDKYDSIYLINGMLRLGDLKLNLQSK